MAPRVQEFVERLLELQPRLQRILEVDLPEAVSGRFGSVTLHQLEALGCLPPEGSTMRQFAASVGISSAAATALADRMLRQGLAERRADPNDRRTVWLAPTAQAFRTLETFRAWQRHSMAGLFERLNASQMASFLEDLGVLVDAGRDTGGDPPPAGSPKSGAAGDALRA